MEVASTHQLDSGDETGSGEGYLGEVLGMERIEQHRFVLTIANLRVPF
jgi:hypothetical protein